jgi:ABC-2 type transport system permease protein
MKSLRKYLYLYKLTIQNMFSDAGKTFIWILVGAGETFVMIFTWLVVAKDTDQIGILSKPQLIAYYIFIFIIWYIVGGTFSHMIKESIKSGKLSNQLTKPIFPYAESIIMEQGWKTFGLFSGSMVLIIFVMVLKLDLATGIKLNNVLASLPAILMGAFTFGFLQFLAGNLTHWLDRTQGLIKIVEVCTYIFGGMLAPLALMPDVIQKVSFFLPFRYIFSFPVEIFQNLINGQSTLNGYLLQGIWVILLFLLCKFTYKKGLDKYESFGN